MNFKVTRTCEFGIIGEDIFHDFDSAKIEFRHIIAEKLGEGILNFTKQIDAYCAEFYPKKTPKEMVALKELLTKLATDPYYPTDPKKIKFDDFEDDRVEFYTDFYSKKLCIYVNDESVKTKFPQAEINVVCMDDPDEEYYFFITDNKSPSDGEHYSTNITLSKEN